MKKFVNKKLYIVLIIVLLIALIVSIIFFKSNLKKNDYSNIKQSMEKVFFYLPEDEYKSMNKMSDYCKLVFLYSTKYMKNRDKEYNKIELMNALKKTIGDKASLNFNINEMDTYDFLVQDECVYGDIELSNISYDSSKKLIFIDNNSKNNKLNNNYIIEAVWNDPIKNGNIIKLSAKALLIEKADNSYNIFSDMDKTELVGEAKTLNEAKKIAKKSMIYSADYIFELERKDNNIIWKSFKRNKAMSDLIVD